MACMDAASALTQHLPYMRGVAERSFVRSVRAAIWPTDRTLPHLRLARNGKQVFSLPLRTSPAGPMFDRRDLRPPLVRLHRQIQVP
jgi:hypothetical protein